MQDRRISSLRFCFRMGLRDCSIASQHICALLDSKETCDPNDCRSIYSSIKNNGWRPDHSEDGAIKIIYHKWCNRYSVYTGQHRICIIKQMDLVLPESIEIMESKYKNPCWYCIGESYVDFLRNCKSSIYISDDRVIDSKGHSISFRDYTNFQNLRHDILNGKLY